MNAVVDCDLFNWFNNCLSCLIDTVSFNPYYFLKIMCLSKIYFSKKNTKFVYFYMNSLVVKDYYLQLLNVHTSIIITSVIFYNFIFLPNNNDPKAEVSSNNLHLKYDPIYHWSSGTCFAFMWYWQCWESLLWTSSNISLNILKLTGSVNLNSIFWI